MSEMDRDVEARANQDSIDEARYLIRTLTTHMELPSPDANSGKWIPCLHHTHCSVSLSSVSPLLQEERKYRRNDENPH
jgi:hypothetical protein